MKRFPGVFAPAAQLLRAVIKKAENCHNLLLLDEAGNLKQKITINCLQKPPQPYLLKKKFLVKPVDQE